MNYGKLELNSLAYELWKWKSLHEVFQIFLVGKPLHCTSVYGLFRLIEMKSIFCINEKGNPKYDQCISMSYSTFTLTYGAES